MKKGDIVKFIGFENYRDGNLGIYYGIIICITNKGIDVLWGTGIVGHRLFPETLDVIASL